MTNYVYRNIHYCSTYSHSTCIHSLFKLRSIHFTIRQQHGDRQEHYNTVVGVKDEQIHAQKKKLGVPYKNITYFRTYVNYEE